MVLDESSVLPAEAALDSAEDEGDECFESSVARPSRPFEDADWTDKDHYYDGDLPTESCSIDEWKRTYRDLDEIQINGAIRRHWSKGKEEVRQVIKGQAPSLEINGLAARISPSISMVRSHLYLKCSIVDWV